MGRGRAMAATDHLDADKIKLNLKTKRIGRNVLIFKSTTSTNDIAAEYSNDKENDGLAIFAERQTAGRGRAGTKWYSRSGDSILVSIVLSECRCSGELLSLACAVATAEAIGAVGGKQAQIKWPNDIILNGRKVAGILLESRTNNGRTSYIVGIGINCHQKKNRFRAELQATATSIDIESGSVCDRISLAKRVLGSMDHWLKAAENTGKKVTQRWRQLSTQLGHRVTVVFNGRKFVGNCIGIDPERGLIVQLDSGGTRFFDAAHASIIR